MAMSSYEIVRRSIEFTGPERLPLHIGNPQKSDVRTVRWNFIGEGDHNLKKSYDEWGCLWVRSGEQNMGQIKGHPLSSWHNLNTFHWPDPNNHTFFEGMESRFANCEGKYVITTIFMLLFERMWALRGFENLLADFYLERENVDNLADHILEFDLGIIQNISQRFNKRIHGLLFSEDWGTQQGLMIKPQLWKDFFKPRYQKLFNAIHEKGWHVWMHSDGRINAILGDLIEIGVDVINIEQPNIVGIEEVGSQYRGQICFETSVDIQKTLPFKSPDEIRKEAHSLLQHWAHPCGGFIIEMHDDNIMALGLAPEKIQIMMDAFSEADPWKTR